MNCKIFDNAFYGDEGSSKHYAPKLIKWDRKTHRSLKGNIFLTDQCLYLINDIYPTDETFVIAWLIEPQVIHQESYNFIKQYANRFSLVLTHSEDLVKIYTNIKWYPFGGTWVKEKDWKQYDKSKLVSIIASNKNFTVGHQFRHQIISQNIIPTENIYGYAYKPVEEKIDALKDYKFSLAIENCISDTYFSEKLIDCFGSYTIPIYFGTKKISKFFNPNGIIFIDDINGFKKAHDMISQDKDLYDKMLPFAKENFEKAKEFRCAEDWIAKNILNV